MSGVTQRGVSSMSKVPHSRARGPLALPFDVECAILDQLSNDRAALHACSLVCRGWTQIAQRRLFHSVVLNVPRRWPNHGKRLDTRCNKRLLWRFLEFLDESPHLTSFIRDIRVDGRCGCLPSLAGFIQEMLNRITRLHTVTFSYMALDPDVDSKFLECDITNVWGRPPSTIASASAKQLPGPPVIEEVKEPSLRADIDTLSISGCSFEYPEALFDVIRNFSCVRHLSIYRSAEFSGNADLHGFGVPPSTVPVFESVTLYFTKTRLLMLLRSVFCVSSLPDGALRSIHLHIIVPFAVDGFLLPCLQYTRNHILALNLDVDRVLFSENPGESFQIEARRQTAVDPRVEIFSEPWDALGRCIASCTVLESLTFVIEEDPGVEDEAQGPYIDYMENILWAYGRLLRSQPPSVRSIVFRVQESFHKDAVQDLIDEVACAEYWGEVDAALSGSLELTRFAFVFNYDEGEVFITEADRVRVLNAPEGVLPKTVGKGVVAFELDPL